MPQSGQFSGVVIRSAPVGDIHYSEVIDEIDGWVTSIYCKVKADTGTVQGRLGLYKHRFQDNGAAVTRSTSQTWNTSTVYRSWTPPTPVKIVADEDYYVAFKADGTTNYYTDNDTGHFRYYTDGTNNEVLPASLPTYDDTLDTWLNAYVDYIEQEAPLTPTWRTPSANGTTVDQIPTLEGNLLQGGDASVDTIDEFQLQVYVLSTGVTVLDTTYATTSTERANGYFTRSIAGLSGAVTYGAKFRTKDSWGDWSASFSAERTFTTVQGPNAPTPIGPTGKLNAINTFNYQATHSHPTPLNANAVQVLVTNNGGSVLYDSGTVTGYNVANGGTLTLAEFHADLAWGTNYKWQMRVRDTANNWGSYTALQPFHTDAAPTAPTNLAPANNLITSSDVFTCNVSDPNGDPVTLAQIEVALVSTGALVTGYPAAMTVNAVAGTASYDAPGAGSGSLTLGTGYKWRARANDGLGPGYGEWSEYAYFVYASVPAVNTVGPVNPRQNLIKQPSAEYDAADISTFWTVTDVGTGQSISPVEEDNAPFGTHVWRTSGNGSGSLRLDTTDYIAIDATKAHAFFVWARNVSGTALCSFQVVCYDAASAVTGTIRPSSFLDMNALTPPSVWTRYGGIVSQIGGTATAFPASTTKIKVRFLQATNTGVVEFDAFSMSPLTHNPATSQERLDAQNWFGYADGDTEGFGVGGYSWTGDQGDSASSVLPILTESSASIVINYFSPASSAKQNDRLIIQKWLNGEWVEIKDTNPTWSTANSNRTIIPIPANTILNEGRYRFKVMVRDSSLIEGSTAWIEYDVYYTGPPQLDILIAESLPSKAQNRLEWSVSTLAPEVFAGIEVQRIDPSGEEPTAILEIMTNPTATEFIDHYPAANREYIYRVRQLEIDGIDQIGGFWSSVSLSCDYYPYSFLKDTRNPALFSAFETEAANLVGYSEDAPVGIMSPWGAERPTVITRSKLRIRTGEVVAAFLPEAGIELPDFVNADTRFERAAAILKRRQTIAILTPAPEPVKVFAAIIGEARTTFPYPPRVRGVEFGWQEVSWSEDYYEREGLD